jgi:hypothetical protein
MNWLNLETKILHAPEYIGSDPKARAAWLNVIIWCAQQENSGRITGAAAWKDRQWQQTCGVTLREIQSAKLLLTWDGVDLVVWKYPLDKEAEVKARREAGREGGIKSGALRSKQTGSSASSSASTTPSSSARTEGEGEGERNENENVLAIRAATCDAPDAAASLEALASDTTPVVVTFQCAGKQPAWDLRQSFVDRLQGLYPSIDVLAQCQLAAAKIANGAVTKKTANGMTRFLFAWMDRQTNSKAIPSRPGGATIEPRFNKF